jgi:hypothetical protein
MRIYVFSDTDRYAAIAPEIPGSGLTGHEERPTREAAIERCRLFAANEIAAYERLGAPLAIAPKDELVEWDGPWWMVPEYLIPLRPARFDAAVRRIDEIASELERALNGIEASRWDRRPSEAEWSVRLTLDHIASGFGVGLASLEPFPLDPLEAHASAFGELVNVLRGSIGRRYSVVQFGQNPQNSRIRWTPRSVARSARALQDAFFPYLREEGPQPRPPFAPDHAAGDDEPLTEGDLDALVARDNDLRPLIGEGRGGMLARGYRYYRDRLTHWPEDEHMRWRSLSAAFRDRVTSASEEERARVFLSPVGPATTIRGELRIGIGHVLGHLAQIRALARSAPV